MGYGKIYADQETLHAIKSGSVHTIEIHGYEDDEVFIYEMVKIEKNGRTYKLEGNN